MDHTPYIRRSGTADTAVLMVHGIMGSPRHFDCFLPLLPEQWDVYSILLEGHGGTLRDFNRASMAGWKTQVQGWVSRLASKYARVMVIAHSMGTLLTMQAAIAHAHKVKAMVLLAPPLRIRVRAALIPRALKVAFGRTDPEDPVEAATCRATSVAPERRLWRYLGSLPHYVALFRLSRQCRGAQPEVPKLVFLSGADELVSPRSGRELQPPAQQHLLAGSGHFYYTPEELALMLEKTKAFLREL